MDKWIVCLKHGSKYNHEYVNKLYNMVVRQSTVPFKFACITEDPSGINHKIKIIPLPEHRNIKGWWYKTWVFSDDLPISGTILFLDLDLVLIRNIDDFWNYHPDQFAIIRDFNRSTVKEWNKFNSSIFRFNKGQFNFVWNNFIQNLSVMQKMHGDQDWIFDQIKKNFVYWPDEWVRSYKWEVRNRQDLIRIGNKRVFNSVDNPKIELNTKVLVFHGDPKPEEVQDPIIIENWQ